MAHNQTIPQIIPPSLTKPPLSLSPFSSTTPPSLFLSASNHVLNTTMSVFATNQSIVGNTTSTTVGALILGLVFLLGVPGNLFIIWSILARARRRSVTTLLILNLAVADGSLMALTPFFIVYLVKKTWIFGDIMCKILFYLCLANMYASIQLIMLMSLHRLVAVVWPRRVAALAGRKAVLRAVLVLWILVLVSSIPALLFRHKLTATQVSDTYFLIYQLNSFLTLLIIFTPGVTDRGGGKSNQSNRECISGVGTKKYRLYMRAFYHHSYLFIHILICSQIIHKNIARYGVYSTSILYTVRPINTWIFTNKSNWTIRCSAYPWPGVCYSLISSFINETNINLYQSSDSAKCFKTHWTALHTQVVLQYTLETVLGFVVPYGLIVGSYICILRRIRQTRFRRRIHSEKLILTIVVTFGIFWLPYHVINIVQVAAALSPQDSAIKARLDPIWQSCRAVTSALAFISSCANPVLYTFAGKSYIRREGFAFMARLFEGTALDSGTRKNRQNSQNSRERDRDAEGLKEKEGELESTTSANVVSPICVKPVKNVK
ncbi:unnamed protein product [Oncorhynchus mykiss]|uniref:G-protein coupled receptors family 1 profile domain-containing protein n=1 Tax=Oncorhynchus mykiss TaxID=8022 RepID=A0A060XKE9_ONCMY|nr:unnamed protein product [Oncorhynchus mykiss]